MLFKVTSIYVEFLFMEVLLARVRKIFFLSNNSSRLNFMTAIKNHVPRTYPEFTYVVFCIDTAVVTRNSLIKGFLTVT